MVPLRILSALWDKKTFEGKSRYFPLPLIHKFFRYQKSSQTQHTRDPLQNVSVLWGKNFSTANRDITLWSKNLFDTRNQWHPKWFPYEFFRHCETKKFPKKSWYFPSLLSINFFATRIFPKHITKGFPCKVFRYCETKKFAKKSWHNHLKHRIFDTRNQWHPKWFRYEFCRHCETKKLSKENLDTSSSLLSINSFATRSLLKHSTQRILYEMFRYCEANTFRRKIVM